MTKIGSGRLTLAGTNSFSGNTLVSGGTLALGNARALQNSTLDTSGSGFVSFGTLASATLGGLTGTGTLNLANSTSAALSLSVGNNGVGTTYCGSLKGPGNLTKIGSGSLTLAGNNTYSGTTAVNQGELLATGSLVSQVTVNGGGVMGGTGTLSSAIVNSGGTLAPGNPLGPLSLTSSLSLLSGAQMDYDLDTPLDSDKVLMLSGTLSLNNQQFSDFHFTALAGFGPGQYTLIDAGSITGSFTSSSGTVGGYPATLARLGNDLVLTVVPEPGTLTIVAPVALCLFGYRWRRRRRKTMGAIQSAQHKPLKR